MGPHQTPVPLFIGSLRSRIAAAQVATEGLAVAFFALLAVAAKLLHLHWLLTPRINLL